MAHGMRFPSPRSLDAVPELGFKGVYIAAKPANSQWNVCCRRGAIKEMEPSVGPGVSSDGFMIPSLCHPHIHIDKAFLLSHPKYADLAIERGDFAEALKLTSEAKSRFEHDDLMERGRAVIEESVNFGVTHMRAFVEVDLGVGLKCLEAGLALKEEFMDRCYVQICVFAQDPIVSYHDKGKAMMRLLEKAACMPGVEAFGSTPYVERDGERDEQIKNMEFAIKTAKRNRLHLDFHIDYNLERSKQSVVLDALDLLRKMAWPCNWNNSDFRTVVFGHCTRLTLFDNKEWQSLCEKTCGLPVAFVGLPTSDLFMMGRPEEESAGGHRARGTLQPLHMIEQYGLNVAIGVNNVGNAFTPQGSCDPLSLASLGVGLYQAGRKKDADLLLGCVSSRAKLAIGLNPNTSYDIELDAGDNADFVVIGNKSSCESFRSPTTTQELICCPGQIRTTVYNGRIVSR